jgi:hypothetical protein
MLDGFMILERTYTKGPNNIVYTYLYNPVSHIGMGSRKGNSTEEEAEADGVFSAFELPLSPWP